MRFPSDLSAFLKLPAVSPRERHFHHDHHSITSSSPPIPSRRNVGLSVSFLSCFIAKLVVIVSGASCPGYTT
jgi:hypothetical protein